MTTTDIRPPLTVAISGKKRWWQLPDNLWEGLSRGSAVGVLALVLGLGSWDRTFGWPPIDLLLWLLAGVLWLALFDGVVTLFWLLARLMTRLVGARATAARMKGFRTSLLSWPLAALWMSVFWMIWPDSPLAAVSSTVVGALVIISLMLGGAVFGVLRHRLPGRTRVQVVGALVVPLLTLAWLLWPGPGITRQEQVEPKSASALNLNNPGVAGPFATDSFTYGDGLSDRREYGTDADVVSQPVDATGVWPGFEQGLAGWWRRMYFGFGVDNVPLNGLVWHPVGGDGPYPLVLIVHGNHTATRPSEPGYAYLAEHLASWGYVAVSVDENFFNGSLMGDPHGEEMAARAWLLTEHIAQWLRWNDQPGFVLGGQIDAQRIGLIGHSRGGEAAALAAAMLERACPPVVGEIDPILDSLRVGGVVSIAPSDASYRPCGKPAELTNTSFLTVNGGMDADVGTFFGLAQYGRTTVDGSGEFKAAVYLHRANHGQFNTTWDYGDLGLYDWLALDRGSLLTPLEQETAARTLITAFLEAAINDDPGYRQVFRLPDAAASWLPDDVMVTRYSDGENLVIDQGSQTAATLIDAGFADSRAAALELRTGTYSQEDTARRLAWEEGSTPILYYQLPAPLALDAAGAIAFDLAAATDQSRPTGVLVTLASGSETASVAADLLTGFRQPLRTVMLKWSWMPGETDLDWEWQTERVLQTYEIPLGAFVQANPQLDLGSITELRIEFDGTTAGSVLIDEVGFRD